MCFTLFAMHCCCLQRLQHQVSNLASSLPCNLFANSMIALDIDGVPNVELDCVFTHM